MYNVSTYKLINHFNDIVLDTLTILCKIPTPLLI